MKGLGMRSMTSPPRIVIAFVAGSLFGLSVGLGLTIAKGHVINAEPLGYSSTARLVSLSLDFQNGYAAGVYDTWLVAMLETQAAYARDPAGLGHVIQTFFAQVNGCLDAHAHGANYHLDFNNPKSLYNYVDYKYNERFATWARTTWSRVARSKTVQQDLVGAIALLSACSPNKP